MKTKLAILPVFALSIALTFNNLAAESKNQPNGSAVKKALKDAGAEHDPEDMKLSKVGPIEVDETYYHVWCGTMDENFRVLIFDNKPSYLGYYVSAFEPVDYEAGAVLLDSGESDEEGNTSFFYLRIGTGGPAEKVSIDGIPSPFVKNEKAELEKKTAAESNSNKEAEKSVVLEYRDWQITMRGQTSTYNAIFVQKVGSKIKIKESKRGKTATIPITALSKADQEYLKQLDM